MGHPRRGEAVPVPAWKLSAHILARFNVVGTTLAVSSAHNSDTVNIFEPGGGRSGSGRDDHAAQSPSGSVDNRDGAGEMEG